MRISDWSSDVCSSDLALNGRKSNGLHSLLGRWQAQRPGVTKSAVNPAVVLYKNSFLFIWYIYLCPLFAFHSKTGPVVHSRSEERQVGKECVSKCRSWGLPIK